MICYINKIQGLLSTLTKKVLFFKDFKALKNQLWISSTFKHFKDLYEPCTKSKAFLYLVWYAEPLSGPPVCVYCVFYFFQ